jgi:hypothetical protein
MALAGVETSSSAPLLFISRVFMQYIAFPVGLDNKNLFWTGVP